MTIEQLIYDLMIQKETKYCNTDYGEHRMLLARIQPQDLPQRDWPKPLPNKRVIIIDI